MKAGRRLVGIILVLLLTFPLVGAGKSKGDVKLDLDDYRSSGKSIATISGQSRSIFNGNITYKIPGSMERIDGEGIFNSHIYNSNKNIYDGELYQENDSVFGIFYFDNDYFIEKKEDKDETWAIERAIISNICPDEKDKLSFTHLKHYNYVSSQSTSSSGLQFDHYVGQYENFRVEFAFTPAKNGLCVIMFIYNHDATPADSAISVMESLKVIR